MLSCGVFARDDNLNIPRLFELYFLSSMMNGDQINAGSFLARQLYSVATSTTGGMVIGGRTTTIARSLGIETNPEDRFTGPGVA